MEEDSFNSWEPNLVSLAHTDTRKRFSYGRSETPKVPVWRSFRDKRMIRRSPSAGRRSIGAKQLH